MKKRHYEIAAIIILLIAVVAILELTMGPGEQDRPVDDAFLKPERRKDVETMPQITITTVYDNYSANPELATGWGFSCVVECGGMRVLFDTGADSPTLLANMAKLGIDPGGIDVVVLSHNHWDHTGGLAGFLQVNGNVKVYIPGYFPDSFRDEITSAGAKSVDVSEPMQIWENIYTTGEMKGPINEQSLILDSAQGLVVVTGCAHPGIVNIVERAQTILNRKVYLALGGFHLGSATDAELGRIIQRFRELGVEKAGPCHCSGDRCRQLFLEEYKDDFVDNGVGNIIEVDT